MQVEIYEVTVYRLFYIFVSWLFNKILYLRSVTVLPKNEIQKVMI